MMSDIENRRSGSIKNAVIAVAGMGKRLGFGIPKCLIKVCGRTLLEYQLALLENVENVFLVVGFRENDVIDQARKLRRDLIIVRNAEFLHTKMLESFYCAARNIEGNAIFMAGDMIVEPESFAKFLDAVRFYGDEITIAVSERISDEPVYALKAETQGGEIMIL